MLIATSRVVRRSNRGAGETGPGAHPNSYIMGTGYFPGIKRPDSRVDHPPPPIAGVKERVEICIYYPSGPSWPVLGCLFGGKLRGRDPVATKRPSISESSLRCHLHETLTNPQLSYFLMQQSATASHRINYDFSHIDSLPCFIWA